VANHLKKIDSELSLVLIIFPIGLRFILLEVSSLLNSDMASFETVINRPPLVCGSQIIDLSKSESLQIDSP